MMHCVHNLVAGGCHMLYRVIIMYHRLLQSLLRPEEAL